MTCPGTCTTHLVKLVEVAAAVEVAAGGRGVQVEAVEVEAHQADDLGRWYGSLRAGQGGQCGHKQLW